MVANIVVGNVVRGRVTMVGIHTVAVGGRGGMWMGTVVIIGILTGGGSCRGIIMTTRRRILI
jgi:hypothetical protein